MSINKIDFLNIGKNEIENNPFYSTLSLFLKYYFISKNERDFYLNSFIRDIIKNENEFKVFIIFKEYALFVYHTKYSELFNSTINIDDIVSTLIGYIKITYNDDKNVLKPFICTIDENNIEILDKFNYIKTTYIHQLETLTKFEKLKEAMIYLEKAKYHEEQSRYYNNLAYENLKDIKNHFEKSFENIKKIETNKILSIKN